MKQEINGENFLGALRRQDERALDYLVEHYAGLIRSVVSRKLYALPAWQEDCQNDILYEVWKNAKRFDGERCSFEGWVAAIARCRCVDYLEPPPGRGCAGAGRGRQHPARRGARGAGKLTGLPQ